MSDADARESGATRRGHLRPQVIDALQQDCESIQAKKHELATCTQQKMLENREMIRCVYKLCY